MAEPQEGASLLRVTALEHLLSARMSVLLQCAGRAYVGGARTPDALVPTDRLIWLEQGRLHYHLEGMTQTFAAGALWLVPAWTRRRWQAAEGGCRLSWIEFAVQTQGPALPVALFEKAPRESLALMRRAVAAAPAPPLSGRMAEMTLKYLLARILERGAIHGLSGAPEDRSLAPVFALMRRHLHDPGLLARLPRLAGMPAQTLQRRFRQAANTSPGRHLEGLRMRQARFLLASTDQSVKEIAGAVGYDDPLYFSRRYRTFWQRSPTEDRAPSP